MWTARKQRKAALTHAISRSSLLVSLSGSFQTTPIFFLNPENGVNYNVVTQSPQYRIQSLQDLQNIPISGAGRNQPEILGDVARSRAAQRWRW